MTRILVALFNIQAGCLRRAGGYDFRRLQVGASAVDEPPTVWLINEAKRWRENANVGLHGAAEALSDELGVPYVGVLGTSRRGPIPPAIIYNPTALTLRSWWNPDDPNSYEDKVNVARFAVRDSASASGDRTEFLAWVDHWHPDCGTIRRQEAARLARYGRKTRLPVIGGADMNCCASGPHLPQRDWAAADYQRRSAEARMLPDGTWVADTDAVDHLIGRWDADRRGRVDGCRYQAIAEIAWRANPQMEFVPTVNDKIDSGGAVIKDWQVVNDAMAPHVDPSSYRVHIPPGTNPHDCPSDHRLVTAAFDLTKQFGVA